MNIALGILCVCILVSYVIYNKRLHNVEQFATDREKNTAISKWFESHPNPTYTQYKYDFADESNIVDYEDALIELQKKI